MSAYSMNFHESLFIPLKSYIFIIADVREEYTDYPFDFENDRISQLSYNEIDKNEAEVRARMIENPRSSLLFGLNPLVVHIKDKLYCGVGEDKDVNNHLYLSNTMRNYFEGILTIPSRTPIFLIKFVSRDEELIDCPRFGDGVHLVHPGKKFQRVTVHIVFLDERCESVFSGWLRSDITKISTRVFQLDLFFEDGAKAEEYLQWRYQIGLSIWEQKGISTV